MALKYEMPMIGEFLTEDDIKTYADAEGYELSRYGLKVEGGMLITLCQGDLVGMSFVFKDKTSTKQFQRVY